MATATLSKPVEIHLLDGQAALLTDFTSSVLAAIAGTGGGKTILGYWWLHSRMEAYPGNTWAMAEPTYNMLSKIILVSSDPARPTLERYLADIGHHPHWISKQDQIIGTDFGQIYLGSADNPDSMQGAAVKGFWLDEPGLMKQLAYQTVSQRVAMMRGQILLTTTPYNLGWLKTDIADKDGTESIHVERWRSVDRPGFPLERYEEEKRRLPPWRFAMIYDALFERPAGMIYNAFNEKVCLINRFPIPPQWLIYSGHDFGTANPAALFYAQDPATGNFYLFAEYLPGAGRSTAQHVQEYAKITQGYNVIKRVGGSHQEDEIRQGYSAHGWTINEPKILHTESQIDKVIGMHQLNKVFVFNDMRNYLDEKRTFSRKLDDTGKPTEVIADEATYHLMAAERYLLSDFTPETAYTGNKITGRRF
jgi:hypothetical protein